MTKKRLFWILTLFFGIAIIKNWEQFEKLFATLRGGKLEWIVMALILQVIFYIFYILHYKIAYLAVDIKAKYRDLMNILLSAIFVNVVTPSAGTAGAAFTVSEMRKLGHSVSRSTAGTLLAGIVSYVAIAVIAVISIVYLLEKQQLNTGIILGSLGMMIIACGMIMAITLGRWQPQLLGWILKILQKIINFCGKKIFKRMLISDDRLERSLRELIGAADSMAKHPRKLLEAFLVGMISYIFNILSVWALFMAFNQSVDIWTLIVGFTMGMLFWTITITPQGVGTVEGAMILTYTSMGIPFETATLVTLTFRGMTLWLPVFAGFWTIKKIST